MKNQPSIGRAEMEILRYVTDNHPVSVRDVADHVAETKGHVRTTVLNVMERLRRKGFLARKRVKGVFNYAPRVPKRELLQKLIHDFVERTLGGSLTPFVAYLAEEGRVTDEEFVRLKELVRDLKSHDRKDRK